VASGWHGHVRARCVMCSFVLFSLHVYPRGFSLRFAPFLMCLFRGTVLWLSQIGLKYDACDGAS